MIQNELLWLGTPISGNFEKELITVYEKPYVIAQSNLEKGLLNGISDKIALTIYTIPSIPYHLRNKKILQKQNEIILNKNLISKTFPIINVKLLRYLFISIYSFYISFIYCSKKNNNKQIFVAANFLPVALPAMIIAKIFKVPITCMFCDLIEDLYSDNISIFRKFYKRFTQYINCFYDSFVFVTEQMNHRVNKKNKKYIVIEGIFNDSELEYIPQKKENVFIYSGSLIKKYGVDTAIKAFKLANLDNYELHIYGDGEYKKEMLEEIKDFPNIKYCGLLNRKELYKRLIKSKFLLNLRNPNDDFTLYSFPSKLFEYLSSGSVVLSTKLKGIPEEYYNYMIVCDTINIKQIAEKMRKLTKMNDFEYSNIGTKGRTFVIENKNSEIQGKKLYGFLFKGVEKQ